MKFTLPYFAVLPEELNLLLYACTLKLCSSTIKSEISTQINQNVGHKAVRFVDVLKFTGFLLRNFGTFGRELSPGNIRIPCTQRNAVANVILKNAQKLRRYLHRVVKMRTEKLLNG